MKISWAEKSSQGQSLHFHAWKFHIFMHLNEIYIYFFKYETFRTGEHIA